jgi:hypothetical protein
MWVAKYPHENRFSHAWHAITMPIKQWGVGVLEYWSIGEKMVMWFLSFSITSLLHHSIVL